MRIHAPRLIRKIGQVPRSSAQTVSNLTDVYGSHISGAIQTWHRSPDAVDSLLFRLPGHLAINGFATANDLGRFDHRGRVGH